MEDTSLPPTNPVPPAPTPSAIADATVPVSNYSTGSQAYPLETLEVHQEGQQVVKPTYGPTIRSVPFSRRRATIVSLIITLAVMLITGAVSAYLINRVSKKPVSRLNVPTQDASVGSVTELPPELQGLEDTLLVNGDVVTRGQLKVVSGSFTNTLATATLTASQKITLPNASGQVCLDSNNCSFATQTQLAQIQPSSGVTGLNNLAGGVTIQGSLNEIAVTTANGVITLSTPQALDANANVQFGSLTLVDGLTVKNGGTGATALTANGVLVGNGTSAINSVVAGAAGQCLLSTAGAPAFQACPGGGGAGVTSLNSLTGALTLQGTANQITVASGGSTITLSTPQDIATTSNVTFNNLHLTGTAQVDGVASIGNGTNAVPSIPDSTGKTGLRATNTFLTDCAFGCTGVLSAVEFDAPGNPFYMSAFNDSIFVENGRNLANSTGLLLNTPGLGTGSTIQHNIGLIVNNQTTGVSNVGVSIGEATGGKQVNLLIGVEPDPINWANVPSGSYSIYNVSADNNYFAGSLGIGDDTPLYALTVGNGDLFGVTSSGSLVFEGSSVDANQFTVSAADPTADRTYTIPNSSAATDTFCLVTLGNCAGTGSGVTTSGGTANRVAKFTSGQNIADSSISDNGTTVTVNGNVNLAVQGTNVTVGVGSSRTGSIILNNSTNNNTVTVQSGATGASYALTLPTAVGATNQCLKAQNGTGTLFWDNCEGGAGGTSGVSSLNGLTGGLTISNASGAGSTITINNAVADGATKGIAAFNATNFSAASGVINTIQNIATSASPQFTNLTLTGDAAVNGGDITSTGALNITPSGALTVGATTQTALLQGSTTTITSSAGNNIVINSGNTIELQDNTNVTGNLVATGTGAFQGASVTIGTASTTNGSLILQNSTNALTVSIRAPNQTTGSAVISLPNTSGANDTFCLATLNNCGGSSVTSIGTIDSQTKSANGAVISGNSLVLQTADASSPGLVSTGTQTLAGAKTLSGAVTLSAAGTALSVTNNATVGGAFTVQGSTNLGNGTTDVTTITGGSTTTDRLVINSVADDGTHGEIHGASDNDFSISSDGAMNFYSDRDADGAGSGSGYNFLKNDGVGGNPVVDINASSGNIHTIGDLTVDAVAFLQTYLRLGVTTASIGDNGNGGTPAAGTITPNSTFVEFTCNDAQGCNVTLSESGTAQGQTLVLINVGANAMNLADIANVQQVAGATAFAGTQYSGITFIHAVAGGSGGIWVETGGSAN